MVVNCCFARNTTTQTMLGLILFIGGKINKKEQTKKKNLELIKQTSNKQASKQDFKRL